MSQTSLIKGCKIPKFYNLDTQWPFLASTICIMWPSTYELSATCRNRREDWKTRSISGLNFFSNLKLLHHSRGKLLCIQLTLSIYGNAWHIWIAATSKAFPIFSHSSAIIHHTERSVKNKNNNRESLGMRLFSCTLNFTDTSACMLGKVK